MSKDYYFRTQRDIMVNGTCYVYRIRETRRRRRLLCLCPFNESRANARMVKSKLSSARSEYFELQHEQRFSDLISFVSSSFIHSFIQVFGMCSNLSACPFMFNFLFVFCPISSIIHTTKRKIQTKIRTKNNNRKFFRF